MRHLPVVLLITASVVLLNACDRATSPDSEQLEVVTSIGDAQPRITNVSEPNPETAGSHEVVVTEDEGVQSVKTTFEGGGDVAFIHPEAGGLIPGTVMRFPQWLTVVDRDAGGRGNTANEPSPETVAFWLNGTSRDVTFDQPVSRVSLFYASSVTVTLEAFDAANNLIASTQGPPNVGQGQGDPTGDFNLWSPLSVDAAADTISRVTVHGASDGTAIDDFTYVGPADRSLRIEADTLLLHPRIRPLTVNTIQQQEREPDTALVRVTLSPAPAEGVTASVTLRAEFVAASGGHAHISQAQRFEDSPRLGQGPERGRSVLGYYRHDGAKRDTVTAETDANGELQTEFVAGYVGGDVRLIGQGIVENDTLADTVTVTIVVPDLVDLEAEIDDVYWIGGTSEHPQGENWHVLRAMVDPLGEIAEEMQDTINDRAVFLQYNDVSLPFGGTFTIDPDPLEDPFDRRFGHEAHATGLDIDISLCYAEHEGNDNQVNKVSFRNGQCEDPSGLRRRELRVNECDLRQAAEEEGGVSRVHRGNHYHIRFENE